MQLALSQEINNRRITDSELEQIKKQIFEVERENRDIR